MASSTISMLAQRCDRAASFPCTTSGVVAALPRRAPMDTSPNLRAGGGVCRQLLLCTPAPPHDKSAAFANASAIKNSLCRALLPPKSSPVQVIV